MEERTRAWRKCLLWRASFAGLVAAAALAGCGGSHSQASEAEAVVHRWQVAVAERDVNEACSLLDAQGQLMVRRELAGYANAHATGASCPSLIGFLHDAVSTPQLREEFRAKKPTEVTAEGDTAKVRASGIFWLTRANGLWRISEVPLAVANSATRVGSR